MSRGKMSKEEQLQKLKKEREKKQQGLEKIKEAIQVLNKKIEDIENQILLKEAEQSKIILSDKDISLVEITKALKAGNFEYLKTIHKELNGENKAENRLDNTTDKGGNKDEKEL